MKWIWKKLVHRLTGKYKTIDLSPEIGFHHVKLDKKRGVCSIGCKHYRASKLLKSAKQIVHKNQLKHSVFHKDGEFIHHNKHRITIKDAKNIIDYLKLHGVK